MAGLAVLAGSLEGPGLGPAAHFDPTVLSVHAATGVGSCDLTFDPDPAAAFHCALTDRCPAALAPVHAPLGRVPVGQGLAAQGPAPASAPLAQAAESHQALPAVHAETQNPPAPPDGACRACEHALAKMCALEIGHAVQAEAHAGPAELHPGPAMAAAVLKGLVTHPMSSAGSQTSLHRHVQWGRGGVP